MKVGDRVYRVAGSWDGERVLEEYILKSVPQNINGIYLIRRHGRVSQCGREWFFLTPLEAWENALQEYEEGIKCIYQEQQKLQNNLAFVIQKRNEIEQICRHYALSELTQESEQLGLYGE